MKLRINENAIPTLAVGFTRSTNTLGNAIALARGGVAALNDPAFPTHALLFTRDCGRLFCTEEQPNGLEEKSLAEYCTPKNRLVAVYHWQGWSAATHTAALHRLADIRADAMSNSKYDYSALFSFIPLIGKWFKPSPQRMICSESCATILKAAGASFIMDTLVTPDQLLALMQKSPHCKAVLGYYL